MALSIRGALNGQRSRTIGTICSADLIQGAQSFPLVLKIGGYNVASLYLQEGKNLSRFSGAFDIDRPFDWIDGYLKEALADGASVEYAANL